MTFDEWQRKHGPNGGAYDIEMQRAGWDGRGSQGIQKNLQPDEQKALKRFAETCEDGQEYDVLKAMMQRLAKIGVVRRVTGSIYEITELGELAIGEDV
jgi:hypothetical protein